jgi:hypothetical protein
MVDVGAGGDEENSTRNGEGDGGGGVGDASILAAGREICEVCEDFGIGLKKLVIWLLFDISNVALLHGWRVS